VFVATSASLFWLVWIYGNGLRDPRYLDGWLLAVGMGAQLYFHVSIKRANLSPRAAVRWRKIHIFIGYLLVAVFISHSDFSLPDTGLEWALWASFILITLSGVLGAYLAWSLRAGRGLDESIRFDRIPLRRAELAQKLHALVVTTDSPAIAVALPAPPQDAWIMDLYTVHLRVFFLGLHNITAHLIGSKRPLGRLIDEIDNLSSYVDQQSQAKLAAIKALVIEKDRLDSTSVYLGLARAWLFVHVPVTYTLIVLAVLHVVVVYAFSATAF
jgi:hypothetical protein